MMTLPWLSASLWLIMPITLNIALLWSDGGTKLLAFLVLLAIVFVNALVVPAVNVGSSRRLYETRISEYCNPFPLYVLAAFSAITTYTVFAAFGFVYTLSNAVANSGLFILAILACLTSYIQARTNREKMFLTQAILLGIPLLVVANLVAFAAGLSGGGGDQSGYAINDRVNQTLGLLGITSTRVSFPLTYGINGFGALSAVAVIICASLAMFAKGFARGAAFFLLPCAIAAILMTDARGAMAYAMLSAVFALFAVRRPALIKIAVPVIFLTPFIPSIGYRVFAWVNSGDFLSALIRSGAQGSRLGFGTGRGDIWESVLNHFTKWDFQHLVGYGALGQVRSGVSKEYAWIFNELGNSTASCHNSFLQYLVDGGYIGAAVWIMLISTFAFQAYKVVSSGWIDRSFRYIFAAILCFSLTQSQTEVFGTIYTPELLMLVILLMCVGGFLLGAGGVGSATSRAR